MEPHRAPTWALALHEVPNVVIPQNASIGNLIEIHGDGGKGLDWTDGCIALENTYMDKIWKLVPENTPVLIVGALSIPKTGN